MVKPLCWNFKVIAAVFRVSEYLGILRYYIWASSWDYGIYNIGDQRWLRRACASAQSRQSRRFSHTWSREVDEGSDQKSDM